MPLRFGSYVQAKILGIEIANASIVPRYLVVNNRVAILDNESKLHYAEVKIVRQQGGDVIISNGLLDGDKLIVSALDYPIDGMKLALASDKEDKDEDQQKKMQPKLSVMRVRENKHEFPFK